MEYSGAGELSWLKLDPRQGAEGWRVWGLDGEEEEEGKTLLEGAQWGQCLCPRPRGRYLGSELSETDLGGSYGADPLEWKPICHCNET